MYIGKAAELTGFSIKAIRFYERIGVIKPPMRIGRYRKYITADIEALLLVKELKKLDLNLSEIKTIITYRDSCLDWNAIELNIFNYKNRLLNEIRNISKKMDNLNQYSSPQKHNITRRVCD